jgi:hypothetical protein
MTRLKLAFGQSLKHFLPKDKAIGKQSATDNRRLIVKKHCAKKKRRFPFLYAAISSRGSFD